MCYGDLLLDDFVYFDQGRFESTKRLDQVTNPISEAWMYLYDSKSAISLGRTDQSPTASFENIFHPSIDLVHNLIKFSNVFCAH